MEPCGFEDQADMIEAVLVILWGRKALVLHEHELRQRRGALDPGDMVYLRCLMRKYGWERRSNADSPCLWQEVFPKADFVAFAWFLLQELLHAARLSSPLCVSFTSLQRLPRSVRAGEPFCAQSLV